jgi:hypothetical protein
VAISHPPSILALLADRFEFTRIVTSIGAALRTLSRLGKQSGKMNGPWCHFWNSTKCFFFDRRQKLRNDEEYFLFFPFLKKIT